MTQILCGSVFTSRRQIFTIWTEYLSWVSVGCGYFFSTPQLAQCDQVRTNADNGFDNDTEQGRYLGKSYSFALPTAWLKTLP